MSRCETTSGNYRCEREANHPGECVARDGDSKPSIRPPAAAPVLVAGLRCPTCDQVLPEKTT